MKRSKRCTKLDFDPKGFGRSKRFKKLDFKELPLKRVKRKKSKRFDAIAKDVFAQVFREQRERARRKPARVTRWFDPNACTCTDTNSNNIVIRYDQCSTLTSTTDTFYWRLEGSNNSTDPTQW